MAVADDTGVDPRSVPDSEVTYYKVNVDTSLSAPIRKVFDPATQTYFWEKEGRHYTAGDPVSSRDIVPTYIQRLEEGNDRLNAILTQIDKDEYDRLVAERTVVSTPIQAEHTNQALQLAEAGRPVLTEDEVLELNSSGAGLAQEQQAEALDKTNQPEDISDGEDAQMGIARAVRLGEQVREQVEGASPAQAHEIVERTEEPLEATDTPIEDRIPSGADRTVQERAVAAEETAAKQRKGSRRTARSGKASTGRRGKAADKGSTGTEDDSKSS